MPADLRRRDPIGDDRGTIHEPTRGGTLHRAPGRRCAGQLSSDGSSTTTRPRSREQDRADPLAGITSERAAAVAEKLRSIVGPTDSSSRPNRGHDRLITWANALDELAVLLAGDAPDRARAAEQISAIVGHDDVGWNDRSRAVPLPDALIAALTVLA